MFSHKNHILSFAFSHELHIYACTNCAYSCKIFHMFHNYTYFYFPKVFTQNERICVSIVSQPNTTEAHWVFNPLDDAEKCKQTKLVNSCCI